MVLTFWISSLDHESFNHSVEDMSIVISIPTMYTNVLNCLGTSDYKEKI